MLYKFSPTGYFGRVSQISRGPWFDEHRVEEDGLEMYFCFVDAKGERKYLLSNNMAHGDRTAMWNLYQAHKRTNYLSLFASGWFAFEAINRLPQLHKLALGWRCFAFFGITFGVKQVFNQWNATTYAPLLGAYLRKYSGCTHSDAFEIRDRMREYYEIDDSQYMAYTEQDLTHEHMHANHGPQPDGEVFDGSYLAELDKFLNNEPNHLTDHKKFLKYPFEFADKSFPTQEAAKDLISGKL